MPMIDHEFVLQDRISKIRQMVRQYGENNFFLSFSGGKDSVALSCLFDEALPGNRIPHVYFNTGIEFRMMLDFVRSLQERDPRIEIIGSAVPITNMLENEGYPFKSKDHSKYVRQYQVYRRHNESTYEYANRIGAHTRKFSCPQMLACQFEPDYPLKISEKCCDRLKKDIGFQCMVKSGIQWTVTGILAAEGGVRTRAGCITTGGKVNRFHPLFPVSTEWVDWYIQSRNLRLGELYYPPFCFARTGCKGCPFNIEIQSELDTLKKYLPEEYRQCESIWEPVYSEYRRLGYRLRKQPA